MAQQSIEFGLFQNDVVGLTEAQRKAEELFVVLSIVDEPTAEYKNFTFPRYQNYYGKCQVMSGVYVVQNIQLQHLNQQLLHFRKTEYGLIDTIVCSFKGYGAAAMPRVAFVPFIVLARSEITSLRFKLRSGVLANITLQWDEFESSCMADVRQPPGAQGKPPGAANSGYNPGNRPAAQGGDPEDFSPNDGEATAPGQMNPPEPGGSASAASWKVAVAGRNNPPDCNPISGIFNTQVTDPAAVVIATIVPDPQGGVGCGGAVKQLQVTVNGAILGSAGQVRSIDQIVIDTSYY